MKGLPKNLSHLVIAKVMRDQEFKLHLLKNPKKAIQEEFSFEIPNDAQIKVLENTEKLYHIVLPQEERELSDAEMQSIAGGGITKPWQNIQRDMGKLRRLRFVR